MSAKYDRVTEILSPFSGLNYVPKDVLENAQVRGTKVHAAGESIIRDLGDWNDDDEISGYIESFKKWWNKDWKTLAIEQRFQCEDLKITGQIDFIYQDPMMGNVLTDIKTSSKEGKTWPLQGSAYRYLAGKNGLTINNIMFLRLRRDGQYPFVHMYEDNFPMFLKCVDVYRFFYQKGKHEPEQQCA